MKNLKNPLFFASFLTLSCGQGFQATTGVGGTSTGAEITSTSSISSGSGGTTSTNSSVSSVGGNTTSDTTSTNVVLDIVDVNGVCDQNGLFVYVPAQDHKGYLTVSCYKPDQYPTKVHGFSYQLFAGTYDVYGCEKNDHQAFWFVTKDNSQYLLPDDPALKVTDIHANDLPWNAVSGSGWSGEFANIDVDLDEINDVRNLESEDIFCFGQKFVFDQLGKPDCPMSCTTMDLLDRHQISTSDHAPYKFVVLSDSSAGLFANFIAKIAVEK